MTMYMAYRREQNAYGNLQPILIGVYFDKKVAREHLTTLAMKFIEEENMGLKVKEEHETRIVLASVGSIVELYLTPVDFDPTGSPWLVDD